MRAALVLVLVILTACGGSNQDDPRTITGAVIEIDSRSIMEVESFTVKNLDETFEIYIDPDLEYDFPVSHLSAHRVGADPVTVQVEEREGQLVATAISDA